MKSLLFVDDEPRILQGLERQLRGMRQEWNMFFAESAARAIEIISSQPIDVIVTDMMMPAMDGAQLLSEVMKRSPKTIRLVLSGHADQEAVLRLVGPAHQYLSKPCNPEELRTAVTRAMALRDLLSNDQLKQVASRIRSLPSLPSLQAQLTEELRKECPSVERIGTIISKDIGMSAKILQLVNSAFFGLAQPASNVGEAVMYLGIATVRSLVFSVQLFSSFDQKTLQGFSLEAVARHCWITGILARRIAQAQRCDQKLDDQCFLGGLLHDLGSLILAAGMPEQYARVIQNAAKSGRALWQEEQTEFGATHAELGAYLLGLWGLPNPVVEAVAMHHHPRQCAVPGFTPVVAVYVADNWASTRLPDLQCGCGNADLDLEYLEQLGFKDQLPEWEQLCLADGKLS